MLGKRDKIAEAARDDTTALRELFAFARSRGDVEGAIALLDRLAEVRPDFGSLTVDAVQKRDIPMIQGTTVLFSCFVVVVNLVVDLVYTLIDPRIRFGRVQS